MEKILLAIDNSEASKKAITRIKELAARLEAEVTVLTVIKEIKVQEEPTVPQTQGVQQKPPSPREIQRREEKMRLENQAENLLDQAQSELQEENITAETVLLTGNAANEICQFAEEKNFDLIVVADRGEGGITRFLLGGTCEKILRYAPTSVFVVKWRLTVGADGPSDIMRSSVVIHDIYFDTHEVELKPESETCCGGDCGISGEYVLIVVSAE